MDSHGSPEPDPRGRVPSATRGCHSVDVSRGALWGAPKTFGALAGCACLCAAAAWGDAVRVADCLDAAGGGGVSASYAVDGCLGGIGGVSSASAPQQTTRHGYIGQLTEVAVLSVTGTPSQVNEGAASQLGGIAVMDDDTLTALSGSAIAWTAPGYPLASIGGDGLATAALVFDETNGAFSGCYLGKTGAGALLVRNTDDDNFGSYAGDGLPDSWQYRYFGLDNPDAAPGANPDCDPHDNAFECIANLVPTNAASRFYLRAEAVPGQPGWNNLIFGPRFENRTYIPQYSTTLLPGSFWTLGTGVTTDRDTERTVTDTNATGQVKFYRIQITNP